MEIIKKFVVNPKRYLFALHSGEQFYIAALLSDSDRTRLRQYRIALNGAARIPIPIRSATCFNADGRWILLHDRPKELRCFVRTFCLRDWQGNVHYGSCVQERLCYQRKLLPPAELAFYVENNVLFSPLLTNEDACMERIKQAINVVLEMVGHCEIWTAEKSPAFLPTNQIDVPWEILRSGTQDQSAWNSYIQKAVECKSEAQKVEIRDRHEHLWKMQPEFCVLGTQNFFGYVVYGFPAINLFLFESNQINNATYVFLGNWEQASRLTKTEVLSNSVQEARIYHTGQWKEHLGQLYHRISEEVA